MECLPREVILNLREAFEQHSILETIYQADRYGSCVKKPGMELWLVPVIAYRY